MKGKIGPGICHTVLVEDDCHSIISGLPTALYDGNDGLTEIALEVLLILCRLGVLAREKL